MTEQYLDQATDELGKIHLHGVRFDQFGLLLDHSTSGEVQTKISICDIPNAYLGFVGVSKDRGSALPIFNFYDMFGWKKPVNIQPTYLFLKKGKEQIGLVIYELPHQVALNDEHIITKPHNIPSIMAEYCNEFFDNNGLWIDFDIFNFLAAQV